MYSTLTHINQILHYYFTISKIKIIVSINRKQEPARAERVDFPANKLVGTLGKKHGQQHCFRLLGGALLFSALFVLVSFLFFRQHKGVCVRELLWAWVRVKECVGNTRRSFPLLIIVFKQQFSFHQHFN